MTEAHQDLQHTLTDLVDDILGVRPGPDDDFFAVGGTSLSVMQLSAMAQAAGLELTGRQIFALRTIRAWAKAVKRTEPKPAGVPGSGSHFEPVPLGGPVPLSPLQEARLLRWQDEAARGDHSIHDRYTAAFRLRGPLDSGALSSAITALGERHSILRAEFHVDEDGAAHQRISATGGPHLELFDEPADGERWKQAVEAYLRRPFAFPDGPLLRTALFRISADDAVLAVCAHHLLHDGWWSMGVLLGDVCAAYQRTPSPTDDPPASLPHQFREFAAWQREQVDGPQGRELLNWWRSRLEHTGPIPRFQLRGAPLAPVRSSAPAGHTVREVAQETRTALLQLQQVSGATPFVAVIAAVHVLLHCHGGGRNVGVIAPLGNRDRPGTGDVIGPFAHLLPFTGQIEPVSTLSSIVEQTSKGVAEVHTHADLPLDVLLRELAPESYLGAWPHRALVFTATQDHPLEQLIPGVHIERIGLPNPRMDNFSLWLSHNDDDASPWRLGADYDADWLASETVADFLTDLETLVRLMATRPHLPVHEVEAALSPKDLRHA
ncbi:condensation domain-containing protein [Streptomyces sp. NPDC050085]|uniref:condensation domain-containing protein n=1 Tax=Streptomyces sp. NPDC050085 TaxID=3365600 RepID=UPI0037A07DAA